MAAAGWATGVGAAAARSIAAIMSPLVTRPSLPEPGTVAASIPLSAASLRTEGASGRAAPALASPASAGGEGRGRAGADGVDFSAGAADAFAPDAAAPSLI